MRNKYQIMANMTLDEVGLELGVSGERVRQIEAKALKKVKDYLLERFGESVTIYDIIPAYKEVYRNEMLEL